MPPRTAVHGSMVRYVPSIGMLYGTLGLLITVRHTSPKLNPSTSGVQWVPEVRVSEVRIGSLFSLAETGEGGRGPQSALSGR